MPVPILLTDTTAHFAPLFTATSAERIRHVDGYIALGTQPRVQLGIRSWQAKDFLVAAISELPAAHLPSVTCTRVALLARRGHEREMQPALFAEPNLPALFAKYRAMAAKVQADKSGVRQLALSKHLFVQVTTHPGHRVCNPYLQDSAYWSGQVRCDPPSVAKLLLGGAYEDFREHRCNGGTAPADAFLVARALIEHNQSVVGLDQDRCVLSTGAFPWAQFSFRPCLDEALMMAPPPPTTFNCAFFIGSP